CLPHAALPAGNRQQRRLPVEQACPRDRFRLLPRQGGSLAAPESHVLLLPISQPLLGLRPLMACLPGKGPRTDSVLPSVAPRSDRLAPPGGTDSPELRRTGARGRGPVAPPSRPPGQSPGCRACAPRR